MRWTGDALELIDQRALPFKVDYPRFTTAAQVADAIRDMVVRGAPAIGCAAAFGVALEAIALRDATSEDFAAGMETGMSALRASRPTAVNLGWAVDRMATVWKHVENESPAAIAGRLVAEATSIFDEDVAANRAIGSFGAALIENDACILTHCNAGALATAGHGTALGVVRSAFQSGKAISVVAPETRPYFQGARLTAWELQREGIPVTVIVDGAAGFLMSQGDVDVVIVGADRIALNGDAANKIGTYGLAVVAARHGIPFYVAAPLSTFDRSLATGKGIPIEQREGGEIRGYRGIEWTPRDVLIANPVFDVTPAELITAIITERGVIRAPYNPAIARLLKN